MHIHRVYNTLACVKYEVKTNTQSHEYTLYMYICSCTLCHVMNVSCVLLQLRCACVGVYMCMCVQYMDYKNGYHKEHPVIKLFWTVFYELPLEAKKKFLGSIVT